ncbi:MAG: histidine--tRNA ligase [Candidatus Nanopelagicaceae bacterium]
MVRFQAPKGVSEYFPPRSLAFERAKDLLLRPARRAGYQLIELPIFEDTELFTRGVGESTDVVMKEMYTFEDRGGRSISLRPEGTAGVMRAVIEHGLDRGQLPTKLLYAGPFFRAERPQAGRYRQFYQVGIEAIGSVDPSLDAEVIQIAHQGFTSLGLKRFSLKITSLGDAESRAAHRRDLVEFISKLSLDQETKSRAERNPLRLFDDKREEIRKAMSVAPTLLDYLSTASKENFDDVLALLDRVKIPYEIDPRMVRGLDYYTGTTFEFVHHDLGTQSGIGGGGRYDGLMEALGGQPLSGIGFGLGIDRVVLACEAEGVEIGHNDALDLFLIPLTPMARNEAFSMATELRRADLTVDISFGERGLKGAMKSADKRGARFVAVVGDDDLTSGEVKIKEMSTGESTTIRLDALEIASKIRSS